MAYSILPAPGTKFGPCEGECEHIDCAGTRRMAAEVCHYCGEQIGYDTKFQNEGDAPPDDVLVHFLCALENVEAQHE